MTSSDTEADFRLDPRLAADTHLLGKFPLSLALLTNDRRFPWLILVPRRTGAFDPIDLSIPDQEQLWREIRIAATALRQGWTPTKLNVAALGNHVRQLHVHLIARFAADAAWPSPVWGLGRAQPYGTVELEKTKVSLYAELERAASGEAVTFSH